jgi:DNA polymerase V
MKAIDDINQKFGSKALFFASSGVLQPWQMKRQKKTLSYTTSWDQIPVVR